MKFALLIAAAAAALSLAACERQTNKAVEAQPAANEPTPASSSALAPETPPAAAADRNVTPIEPTPAATTAPHSTEALITGVTLTDLYQVQAGKIAEAKAQSPEVKALAKTMVTDHPAMTNQMKHLFATTNVKAPTELGPRGKAMIEALNTASPAEFDRLYLEQQQAAQEAELALLKGYAENGESKDIKPAAAKAAPRTQAHLDKVREMRAAMK